MSHDALPSYGLWSLVVINTLVFMDFRVQLRQAEDSA